MSADRGGDSPSGATDARPDDWALDSSSARDKNPAAANAPERRIAQVLAQEQANAADPRPEPDARSGPNFTKQNQVTRDDAGPVTESATMPEAKITRSLRADTAQSDLQTDLKPTPETAAGAHDVDAPAGIEADGAADRERSAMPRAEVTESSGANAPEARIARHVHSDAQGALPASASAGDDAGMAREDDPAQTAEPDDVGTEGQDGEPADQWAQGRPKAVDVRATGFEFSPREADPDGAVPDEVESSVQWESEQSTGASAPRELTTQERDAVDARRQEIISRYPEDYGVENGPSAAVHAETRTAMDGPVGAEVHSGSASPSELGDVDGAEADNPVACDVSLQLHNGSEVTYADEPESRWAADVYQRIRDSGGEEADIAENCAVPGWVVARVKEHVFREPHDIAVGPDRTVQAYFTPDDEVARLWLGAAEGSLESPDVESFRRLLVHEYVESKLMDSGMPYRSTDPAAYARGFNEPTAEHHGAHDVAPLRDAARPPFDHWLAVFGRPADITVASNLSNLDEVVEHILRGRVR